MIIKIDDLFINLNLVRLFRFTAETTSNRQFHRLYFNTEASGHIICTVNGSCESVEEFVTELEKMLLEMLRQGMTVFDVAGYALKLRAQNDKLS